MYTSLKLLQLLVIMFNPEKPTNAGHSRDEPESDSDHRPESSGEGEQAERAPEGTSVSHSSSSFAYFPFHPHPVLVHLSVRYYMNLDLYYHVCNLNLRGSLCP
jgi:hypothetical protein